MRYVFRNFVWSFLSEEVLEVDTVLPVEDTSGFPALAVDEIFMVALHDGEQDPELVKMQTVGVDTITVERAQEGTTARIWPKGTKCFNAVTAAMFDLVGYPATLAENVEVTPGGDLSSTNVQDALLELQGDIDIVEADLDAVEADIAAITAEILALPGLYAPLVHTHPSTDITDFSEAVDDRVAALLVEGTNISFDYDDALNTLTIHSSGGVGGGVTDGDKGDITISAGGTVWEIDPNAVTTAKLDDLAVTTAKIAAAAVTNAKLANMPTLTMKGNDTGGSADPKDLTVAEIKALLSLVGSNSGDQTITLTSDVTGSGTGSFATTIANNAVTLAKMADMATASFIGRNTAGTGDPEVLAAATAKTMLGLTGTNSGDQTITLTSDVTGSGTGSFATTIAANAVTTTKIIDDAVTNAKLANMAANMIKGRAVGAGTGDPTDLTGTQATAILNIFTSTLQGLAPLSGGGTANFLRADATWATPSNAKLSAVRTYLASTTWSKPANLDFIIVEVQGGGGGGGGADGTASQCAGASGGAAGGYTRKKIAAASLASSETVTVGAAGTGGAGLAAVDGTAGGTSSFGAHCSATGGGGGNAMAGGTTPVWGEGPDGGVGSGGDLNANGTNGGMGMRLSGTQGRSGDGGPSFFGGGVRGGRASNFTGQVGGAPGAGGSGAHTTTATDTNGGNGVAGAVIVYEYLTV